jgi:hypothetical protein
MTLFWQMQPGTSPSFMANHRPSPFMTSTDSFFDVTTG